MKLSQIRRRIDICLREIIFRFEMNFQNLFFSWQFNSYSCFKASIEVLSNWAVETLGQSTRRGLDAGVKMYIMHHMEADLRDLLWLPSLGTSPLKGLHRHVLILCGEIGHSHGDCSDAFEPEVHDHSLESNQCFLDHSDVSRAENSQASTSCERPSRQQESTSMPLRRAIRTLSPGGAEQVTCTVQDWVQNYPDTKGNSCVYILGARVFTDFDAKGRKEHQS
jgi:hypothetical protein